jgi:hypothetical protein
MIAQPFAKFDDVLSVELAYERLNSETLFKLIAESLQYEAHNPSLALVQTLLLLCRSTFHQTSYPRIVPEMVSS